jgi:hypothetical protein
MSNKPLTRLTTSIALASVVAAGCHSHDDEGGNNADEYFYDCESTSKPAALTVFATDEAYREFLDKVVARGLKVDEGQAAQLTAPAAGATLSAGTPPTFTFTDGGVGADAGRSRPGGMVCPPRRSRWARLWDALSFEGTAWAHCPAVTGTLYLVQVTEEGGQDPAWASLASVTSFTPTAATWKAKLMPLVGKKVKVTLARGVFSQGRLESGPFVRSEPMMFSVVP